MESYEKSFNLICRLCLRYDESNKNTSLVDSNRENGLSVYGELITKLTSLNIHMDDNLPKNICFGCKNELKRIECFKSMCKTNCERLSLLVNYYHKNSSEETKIEAAIQYSMFMQHFPDKYQVSYFKKVKEIPLKRVKEKLHRNSVTKRSETAKSCENGTVLPKIEVEIDYNDTYNFSDHDSQNAPTEDQSRSKSEDIDSLFDQMANIFTKSHSKPKKHLNPNNSSDTESCIAPSEDKSHLKSKEIDSFLDQMESIFSKPRFKPKKRLICKTQPKNFTCNICNKKLANKNTYRDHMQSHGQYLFICDQCGKGFPTKASINIHLVARHGVPSSYQCDSCSFKAPRRLELIEHIRLHTGERPFTCEKCGRSFRRRAIYANHLKCHEERKIQCPLCPKKFYRAGEMKAHMNNVHERIYLYLCRICNTSYARTTTVRKHMTTKHGIAKENQGKILRVTRNTHRGLFKEGKDDEFY